MPLCLGTMALFRTTYCLSNLHTRWGSHLDLPLQANSAVALHQLAHSIRELGAAVVERQGALTQALEGSRCRKAEALSAQVSEKQGLLEQAGLMTYTQELLKETDAPCFVQAARVTHHR